MGWHRSSKVNSPVMNRFLFASLLLLVTTKSGICDQCSNCRTYECEVVPRFNYYVDLHCDGRNITSFIQTTYSRFVIRFNLQNNLIETIEHFPTMASLQLLNLSHNAISNVSWESLGNMPDLLQLDLSFNRLTYVDVSPRRSLILFSVIYNKLETFSEEDLGILPRDLIDLTTSYKPYVEGNPLRCDCRMIWLQKLLQGLEKCQTGGDGRFSEACKPAQIHPLYLSLSRATTSGFVCNSPENVHGVSLSKVDLSVCDYGNSVSTPSTHLSVHQNVHPSVHPSVHPNLVNGTMAEAPSASTTDNTTHAVSLSSNKTLIYGTDLHDGLDADKPWYNVSLPTLLKVLGSVAAAVVVVPVVVVLKKKCGARRSGEAPPPIPLIPLPHIQNSLYYGNNSGGTAQEIHDYETIEN
ncbi:LRFN1 [Branchiostoma lanceolatum]|uniref:LRFN1 protein n=1 Tax=Branchiostoma lanceolatum TaxID=7740 RepID=A0A8J9YS18_BRALA|nr:LRFN1 [Branchiostoma lanceolatum]